MKIQNEKNAPGMSRTFNLLIRSQMLYPIELRARDTASSAVRAPYLHIGASAGAKSFDLALHRLFWRLPCPMLRENQSWENKTSLTINSCLEPWKRA